MPLDQSFVGRSYPPTAPYEVGREKIREFADAIGDASPAYRDPAVARPLGYSDVIAPPTFAIILTMAASRQITHDPALGIDYSRVVHGEQKFSYVRPIQADDRLQVVARVEAIRSVGGNDIVTSSQQVSTVSGEPVVTALATLVVRGPEA